jgi:hypothetical protein
MEAERGLLIVPAQLEAAKTGHHLPGTALGQSVDHSQIRTCAARA